MAEKAGNVAGPSTRVKLTNDDVNTLTTFGNPFAEDEADQTSYALVSSLFSKVRNTFATPSNPAGITSATSSTSVGSNNASSDNATREFMTPREAPLRRPSATSTIHAAQPPPNRTERPVGFGLRQPRAAPPLMSLTPVISEAVVFPQEHSDSGSFRGGGSPAPYHHISPPDGGEPAIYGNAIPGFPIQDDTKSIRTVASNRRNGSASKVIRRLRGEGLSREYWMDDENCKECYDCKSVFSTWRRKHHCRICGQIFCSRCASNIIKGSRFGQEEAVRVCNLCLRMLEEEDDDDDDRRSIASVSTNFPAHQLDLIQARHPQSPYSASQLFSRVAEPFNLYSIGEMKRSEASMDEGYGSGSRPSTPAEVRDRLFWEYQDDEIVPPPFRRGLDDDDKEGLPTDTLESYVGATPSSLSTTTLTTNQSVPVPFPIPVQTKDESNPQSFIQFPGSSPSNDGSGGSPRPIRSRFNSYATEYDPSVPFFRNRVHSKLESVELPQGEAGWRTRRESSAYAAELNAVSMFHLRVMLRQMIAKQHIPHAKEWEETLLKLALKVASYLNLNPKTPGSSMDARWYVKIKKIPGGAPRDSEYVDGAVITKNVAHKQMSRHLRQPRIMLVTFPFDWHRVEGQFMSIDPILAQEREYLKNLALRVAAHHPHIVLVEGTVSRLALEYLLEKKIAVARSVKPSAIQFVSRITQSDIISSMDRLALEPRMGDCARFRIQTFEHNLIPGRRKTYMRFEGCSREMGCTLILRGGDVATLQKIKKVTSFMVFIVRNLKMETYLWKDSVVTMPPVTGEAAPLLRPRVLSNSSVFTLSAMATGSHTPTYVPPSQPRWTSTDPISEQSSDEVSEEDLPQEDVLRIRLSKRIKRSIEPYFTTFISASATLRFPPPYPIKRMKELDDQLERAKRDWEDAEAELVKEEQVRVSHNQERTITLNGDAVDEDESALLDDDEEDLKTPGLVPNPIDTLPSSLSRRLHLKDVHFDLRSEDHVKTPMPSQSAAPSTVISTAKTTPTSVSSMENLNRAYFDLLPSSSESSQLNSNNSSLILHDPSKVVSPSPPTNVLEVSDIAKSSELAAAQYAHHEHLRIWEWYLRKNADDFVVEKYQKISLLFAKIPTLELGLQPSCIKPRIEYMTYYGENDKSLQLYIEEECRNGSDHTRMCDGKGCKFPEAHHSKVFVHNESRLLIATEPWRGEIIGSPEAPPPNPDFITTWSVCRICGKNTPFIPLTEESGKYSFAKFLELHFYPADVRLLRGAGCLHNIYLHHMRYFAVNKMTLRFQSDPIKLYEITLPPMRTRVRPEALLELKNQDYRHMLIRNDDYWDSVLQRIKQWQGLINPAADQVSLERGLVPLSVSVAEISQRYERDRKEITNLIHKTYANSPPTDTLASGPVRTATQNQVVQWDTEFDRMEKAFLATKSYMASDKDFRKLTGTNLKRVYDFINGGTSSVSEAEGKSHYRPHVSEIVNPSSSASENDSNVDNDSNADSESIAGSLYPQSEIAQSEAELEPYVPDDPSITTNLYIPPQPNQTSAQSDADSDSTIGASRIDATSPPRQTEETMEQLIDGTPTQDQGKADEGKPPPRNMSRLPRRLKPHPSVAELVRQFQGAAPDPDTIPLATSPKSGLVSESEYEQKIPPPPIRRRGRSKVAPLKEATYPKASLTSDFEGSYAANVGPRHLTHVRKGAHHGIGSRIPGPATESRDEVMSYRAASSRQTSPIRPLAIPRERRIPFNRKHAELSIPADGTVSPSTRKTITAVRGGYPSSPPERRGTPVSRGGKSKSVVRHPTVRDRSVSRTTVPSIAIRGSTRRVAGPPPGNKVSNIARQFEKLSKDSERANRRYAIMRGRRARPVASGKAKVEIFQNIMDAARDDSDEESDSSSEADDEDEGDDVRRTKERSRQASPEAPRTDAETSNRFSHEERLEDEPAEPRLDTGRPSVESEGQEVSAPHPPLTLDLASPVLSRPPSPIIHRSPMVREHTPSILQLSENEMSISNNERASMIHTIVGYSGLGWMRESAPTFVQLKYPASPSEHLFEEAPITIREDEPTSIIAFALQSAAYRNAIHKSSLKMSEKPEVFMPDDVSVAESRSTWGVISLDGSTDYVNDLRSPSTITHPVLHFESAGVHISCTVFHAEQFDALRRSCHCESSLIESLARCVKWDASGGKSGSAFLKTRDDRFIAKELTKSELDSMSKFAPKYFEHMANSMSPGRPSLLAKIFGFYKVVYRNTVLGKTVRMTLMVMENLFYDRRFCQIYDLKGSSRNRLVNPSKNPGQVLLDENLVQNSHKSPFYIREHSKRILRGALWNDTEFLSDLDVMDYSLLVAVDDKTGEIVVGIVDFIRTYTWDKRLETILKESTFGKGEPTIITPKQYKARFRNAMERYFLLVPDRWMKQMDHPEEEGQGDW